ncbi:unnamed protein product [Lymnaea stagnalis]|uniref:poly(ADP-ribose) glycohydrolase n=1 Tax=Lymnaea stagnalis TaxID=6523 RepID=A0AAV2H4U5_LYMST
MHKTIFPKILKRLYCKKFTAYCGGSVMSKKELIQSKLNFSSKTDSPEEKRLALKRKNSDPLETRGKRLNMSYSDAVAGHGRGKNHCNKGEPRGPSTHGRGKDLDSRHSRNSLPFEGPNVGLKEDSNFSCGPSTSNDRKSSDSKDEYRHRQSEHFHSSGSDRVAEEKSGRMDNVEDKKKELNPKYLPKLNPRNFEWHKIFFDLESVDMKRPPKPYPDSYRDHWDEKSDKFVFMPCSARSYMPSGSGFGTVNRWERIQVALSKNIPGVFELEEVILSYNQHYEKKWNFHSLYEYFDQLRDEDKDRFFQETLPEMKRLALKLPIICTESLPILGQYKNMKISITQEQAACLLANAFFCTFPKRNFKARGSKLPDINFSNLYSGSRSNRKIEKLKCIINYFKRVTENMPVGTLTYTRQYLFDKDIPNWKENRSYLNKLTVFENGTIEDNGENMLQADFANKYVGGGALGQGLVQEEIRFMICPEMIVARLFTECLTENEVLIMTGCERFSSYTGYSDTFKFDDNFMDETQRDNWGRRSTEVVAMDALVIRNFSDQFKYHQLTRELKKAYCAFSGKYKYEEFQVKNLRLPPVCTGNWGCGAFGGDKQVKALIQLMAASLAEREVHYFTFGDGELRDQLEYLYETIVKEKVTVRSAFGLITEYGQNFSKLPSDLTLFDYIFQSLNVANRPKSKVIERQSSHRAALTSEDSSD